MGLVAMSATAEALWSPIEATQWHRVASMHPRVRAGVTVQRLQLRGQRWHVWMNDERSQGCRLDARAHDMASRMDGRLSMQALWEALERHGQRTRTEAPSQEDLMQLLMTLHRHGLLDPLDGLDAMDATPPQGQAVPTHAWQWSGSSPDDWLDRHARPLQALFSGPGVLLLLLLISGGLWGSLTHADALGEHLHRFVSSPGQVLAMLACYPLLKAVHELGHALALRQRGGKVPAWGISLRMLWPLPFVDASASHAFPRARDRVAVSAAGILVEMACATVGLCLWLMAEPGPMKELGFALWFMGGVSTLLFNGNPLQKLDGHHMLTDWLEMPGLAAQSNHRWQSQWRRWLSGPMAPNEASLKHTAHSDDLVAQAWTWCFAPLAWLWQWVLWGGLAIWLGQSWAPAGWMVWLWMSWRLLVRPCWTLARQTWDDLHLAPEGQHRPWWRLGLLALPCLVCLPVPEHTVVKAVVWPPEQALIRAPVAGEVMEVMAQDGQPVKAGQALLLLHNPQLHAQWAQAQARLARSEQQQYGSLGREVAKAGQAQEEAEVLTRELMHIGEQIEALTIRAGQDGVVRWQQDQDMRGRFIARGEWVGHLSHEGPLELKAAVPQDQAKSLQRLEGLPDVLLPGNAWRSLKALSIKESGTTQTLPSAALGDGAGGAIPVDPGDAQQRQTLRPVVMLTMTLPRSPETATLRLGQTTWVRLPMGWRPLSWQWADWQQRHAALHFSPH